MSLSQIKVGHANINKGLSLSKAKDIWAFLKVEDIKLGFFTETGPPLFDVGKYSNLFAGYKFIIYKNTKNIDKNGILVVWDKSVFNECEVIVKFHKDCNGYCGNIISWVAKDLGVAFLCVYAPNGAGENWMFLVRCMTLYRKLQKKYTTIITGDLNVTLNLNNRLSEVMPDRGYLQHSAKVASLLSSYGLLSVQEAFDNTVIPTRVHYNGTETTLDYFLTEEKGLDIIEFCVKLPISATFSDHCPLIVQINVAIAIEDGEPAFTVDVDGIGTDSIQSFRKHLSECMEQYVEPLTGTLNKESLEKRDIDLIEDVVSNITGDVLREAKEAFGVKRAIRSSRSMNGRVDAHVDKEWINTYRSLKAVGKAMEVVRKLKCYHTKGIQIKKDSVWSSWDIPRAIIEWSKKTPLKLFCYFSEEITINRSDNVVFVSRSSKRQTPVKIVNGNRCKEFGVFGSVLEVSLFLRNNSTIVNKLTRSDGFVFGERETLIRAFNGQFWVQMINRTDYRRINDGLKKMNLQHLVISANMDVDKWNATANVEFSKLMEFRRTLNDKMVEESANNAVKFQRRLFFTNRKKLSKLLYNNNKISSLTRLKDKDSKEWVDDFDAVAKRVSEFWAAEANSEHTGPGWCWGNLCSSPIKEWTKRDIIAPITFSEVLYCLFSKGDKSTPGIDDLSYRFLKLCPEKVLRILVTLFNVLYFHNVIPECWKTAVTILIPKKGIPEWESDWRPITLQSALFKTYTTILNKRLMRFMLANSLISEAQNGFIPIDGCCDQTLLLQAAIRDAKQHKRKLYLLFVDFKNAYGKASHKAIGEVMDKFGIPKIMCNFVRTKLEGCKFRLRFNGFESEPIEQNSGVAQGDPNSPLEYIIFQEPLHRWIETHCKGYTFSTVSDLTNNMTHKQNGYADDIVGLTSSLDDLETMLSGVNKFCEWGGSNINAKKCAIMALDYSNLDPYVTINLKVKGEKIPCVKEYTYLGVVVNAYLDSASTCLNIDNKLAPKLIAIDRSTLDGLQKIEMMKAVVLGTFRYYMPNVNFTGSYLNGWNKICRKLVRRWLGTFRLPNAAIHLPISFDSLGVTDLITLDGIRKTAFLAKKLCSKREKVRTVSHMMLQGEQQYNHLAAGEGNLLLPEIHNFMERPNETQILRASTAKHGKLAIRYNAVQTMCICGFRKGQSEDVIQCIGCSTWFHKGCIIEEEQLEPRAFWCPKCTIQEISHVEADFRMLERDVTGVYNDILFEDTKLGLSWSERIPEWEADIMWELFSGSRDKVHRLVNGQWWVDYDKVAPPNAVNIKASAVCEKNTDGSVNLDKEIDGIAETLMTTEHKCLAIHLYNNLLYKILTKGWIARWKYNFGRNSKGKTPVVWNNLLRLDKVLSSCSIDTTWLQDPKGNMEHRVKFNFHDTFQKMWSVYVNNRQLDPNKVEQELTHNVMAWEFENWKGSSSSIDKSVKSEELLKLSSKYLYDYSIAYTARRAHLLARKNAWPTNHRLFVEGQRDDDKCPFCGMPETVAHIMVICEAYKHERIAKHDNICRLIMGEILAHRPVDNTEHYETFLGEMLSIKFPEMNLKPDITMWKIQGWDEFCFIKWNMHPDEIRRTDRNKYRETWTEFLAIHTPKIVVIIIEVGVSWDTKMEEALERKKAKYSELCTLMAKRGCKTMYIPIIVGALGTLNNDSIVQLRKIGLVASALRRLIKKVSRVICMHSATFYSLRWSEQIQRELKLDVIPMELI